MCTKEEFIERANIVRGKFREMKNFKSLKYNWHEAELTVLEGRIPGVKNYHIAAKKKGADVIFLRKILRGGADQSYGIEVAKLAGLPEKVLQRARTVLRELEEENGVSYAPPRREEDQVCLSAVAEGEVLDALRRCQTDALSPLEALNLIYEWKRRLSQ